MVSGDAITGISSITAGASLTIRPGSNIEWCIHNIFCGESCEIYFTDGNLLVKFDTNSANSGWKNQVFFLTNSYYITVKNISAVTATYGYTGVVTK